MIDQLSREDFTGLPSGALHIDHQGASLPMEVLELRELPPISPRAAPFAVVLSGPASPMLPQGLHALVHPVHGRLELFMVPIARDARGTRYEIIFN